MTIKNLWSLNVDEVITAQKIKSELGKEYEVFFPINSQLKDIDLLLQHPRTGKSKSVQVKGSRTYSPKESEIEHLGWGYDVRTSWNQVKDASIFSPTNKIDWKIQKETYKNDFGEWKIKITVNGKYDGKVLAFPVGKT